MAGSWSHTFMEMCKQDFQVTAEERKAKGILRAWAEIAEDVLTEMHKLRAAGLPAAHVTRNSTRNVLTRRVTTHQVKVLSREERIQAKYQADLAEWAKSYGDEDVLKLLEIWEASPLGVPGEEDGVTEDWKQFGEWKKQAKEIKQAKAVG